MKSAISNPGAGAAVAHRPKLYRELRMRNERTARVAQLIEARRIGSPDVASLLAVQRARRFKQAG